jgi:hypothetical protein
LHWLAGGSKLPLARACSASTLKRQGAPGAVPGLGSMPLGRSVPAVVGTHQGHGAGAGHAEHTLLMAGGGEGGGGCTPSAVDSS